jgi:hypothetical protein
MAHPDLDDVKESHELWTPIMDRLVENSLGDTSELGGLRSRSFALATFQHHLGLRDQLPKTMRLALDASVAILASVQSPERPVTYTLAGRTATKPGNTSFTQAGIDRWDQMLCGAIVLGDAATLRTIATVPRSVVVTTRIKGLELYYDWYDLLAPLGAGAAIDEKLLARARTTDVSTLMKHIQREATNLYLPALDVLHHLVAGDAAGLNASIAAALAKHKKYWSGKKNQRDPSGYVSWPLSALAELARRRGMAVDVESFYLIRMPT